MNDDEMKMLDLGHRTEDIPLSLPRWHALLEKYNHFMRQSSIGRDEYWMRWFSRQNKMDRHNGLC